MKIRSYQYPSLTLRDGAVCLVIGGSSRVWRLSAGQQVRFNRHGTFGVKTVSETGDKAIMFVHLPRKGWNPTGPTRHDLSLIPGQELSVRRGVLERRNADDESLARKYDRKPETYQIKPLLAA